MIIAIDGPSGSGKGTIARLLGEKLGFAVLDTGLLYRLLGYMVLENGGYPGNLSDILEVLPHFEEKLPLLSSPLLREDKAAQAASLVAQFPVVREQLLAYQRQFAKTPPSPAQGAILDGRDIGTVVCPGGDFKFFITASAEIRAQRRWKELQDRGIMCMFDDVLQDLKERDDRDTNRTCDPLKPAPDAVVLDTSDKSPQDVLSIILDYISQHRKAN